VGRGGGAEIADGLYSASLPRTALMNPIGKGGGLPRLLSISVLWARAIGDYRIPEFIKLR
jgi:hypothetical protein